MQNAVNIYKQKKQFRDASFEETERIIVNAYRAYRANKKINLRQKKLLSMKKIDLENRNTNFKKGNSKYQIIIRKQQHL